MGKISKNVYKNLIFYKKWHIHLYMSIFFCNFAAKMAQTRC